MAKGVDIGGEIQGLRSQDISCFMYFSSVLAFSRAGKALPYPVNHEFQCHLVLRHFKLVDRNPPLTIVISWHIIAIF